MESVNRKKRIRYAPVENPPKFEVEEFLCYGESRYRVVDPVTGDVLDDAGGNGYRNPRKACQAHVYGGVPEKKRRKRERKKELARIWWHKHKAVNQAVAEILEGGGSEAEVKDYLASCGDEFPCPLDEFMDTYYAWRQEPPYWSRYGGHPIADAALIPKVGSGGGLLG